MPLGNATFATLFFVSCAVGISDTICGHVEHNITYCLADVAHTQPLWLFNSNSEWYRTGMQLFAYNIRGKRWNKSIISWGIMNDSRVLDRQTVLAAAERAFAQWSAACSLSFTGPVQPADIRIKFVPSVRNDSLCEVNFGSGALIRDKLGVDILLSDNANWTGQNRRETRVNIRYMLLYAVGNALGVAVSNVRDAVMCLGQLHVKLQYDYDLRKDDIDAIQSIYGPPSSKTNRSQPPSSGPFQPPSNPWDRRQPPSSGPFQPPSNPWDRRQPPSSGPFQPPSNPWDRRQPPSSGPFQLPSNPWDRRQPPASTSSSSQSSSSTESSSSSASSDESEPESESN